MPEKEFNKAVESREMLETNDKKSYTILDLLRYPVLRKRSLILGLAWYVICIAYNSYNSLKPEFHSLIPIWQVVNEDCKRAISIW